MFRSKPLARRYAEELSAAYRRGYPLFDPQPDSSQGSARPVEIGDVGYVNPVHGYFVTLFNIHLDPGIDGQPSRDQLPDNFEPLPRGGVRECRTRGMHLFISTTINAPEVNASVPAGPFFGGFAEFSTSNKHGAILATPDPLILSSDSLSDRRFEEYFEARVRNWERFLAAKAPGRVELEELMLITGVDRTTSWANAAFSDTALKVGFGLEVQFVPGAEIACRYTWRNSTRAFTKFGPNPTISDFAGASSIFPARDIHPGVQPEPSDDHSVERRPVNSELNQTIFVRHLRCKRRWNLLLWTWRRRGLTSRAESDGTDEDMADEVLEDGPSLRSDADSEYMTANEDVNLDDSLEITSSLEHEDFTDHLEPVLDYILQHSDTADIAIARHKDLDLLRQGTPPEVCDATIENRVAMIELPSEVGFPFSGYVAKSLDPGQAERLFNIYTRSDDCRAINIHFHPMDNSYRRLITNPDETESPLFDSPICYKTDNKGAVVPQTVWMPLQRGDVQRHTDDAGLVPPIYFIGIDHGIGIKASQVLDANIRAPPGITHPTVPAPLGGRANTHLCLKWPGYDEFKKQVELRNASGSPITMYKLVERSANFVQRFIQEMADQPIQGGQEPWRVGPGFITAENIYVVGLMQVSRGVWQPILQLDHFNTLP
ncbi:unnamed protein product [Peniophora sp. CBMAI 1063]|nr:unnamed protein product [Peniophora sp. CBMAI 1063]